ncbi:MULTISPECIES: cation:proton antiporter [unclassified Ruegeria]|uniref:cation:proton antiporter n=1 Tax=unclassified Ruegeria TaxID=2625375 RepID=UPI0014892A71|nr:MULTISPECIES: cation:proton antiporter [unclassified Ruegeria]
MNVSGLLITLGVLFLAGLVADQLGRATHLPRVTALLFLGLIAGNAGTGVIPRDVAMWFDEISIVALTMVAFLLGGSLTRQNLVRHGRAILAISISIVVATIIIVTGGLTAIGLPPGLALVLAAIATATAPAAMTDVIQQSGVSNGFTETLKGVVAIDDVWGLMVFSIALVVAGHTDGWVSVTTTALWDFGGAILLGVVLGVPSAYLTGRLKPGEPMQAEAIGIVFLTAGFALWLEVSFLVAGMVVGATIGNLARHHDRAFHEIEHIQWPFMILFFLLAGATLDIESFGLMGWAGVLFLILRTMARLIGGYCGARLGGLPVRHAYWYGPALLPQAGVAVGMALVAGEQYPHWAASIMAFTLASTVVFEVLGPPLTLFSIRRTADTK